MSETTKPKLCKTCHHWRNEQRLLNYSKSNGVCLNPVFKFNTANGRLIGVLDVQNIRDQEVVSGVCSHNVETMAITGPIAFSRYLLQTNENFGCIYHEK